MPSPSQAWNAVANTANAVVNTVQSLFTTITVGAQQIIAKTVETFQAGAETVQWIVSKTGEQLAVIGGKIIEASQSAVKAFADKMAEYGKSISDLWALAERFGTAAPKLIKALVNDPLGFAKNVVAGIGKGFGDFFSNIGSTLQNKLMEWLTSGLKTVMNALPPLPTTWDLKGTVTFMLGFFGLSWENVQNHLINAVGPGNIALIGKVYGLVENVVNNIDKVDGLYDLLQSKIEGLDLSAKGIFDMVLNAGIDYVQNALITKAIPYIALKFASPAVGLLGTIYDGLTWLFNNANKIGKVVDKVVTGMKALIDGNTTAMAKAVKDGLDGLVVPAIDMLATQLKLNDLPQQVGKVIGSIKAQVDVKLAAFFSGLVKKALPLLGLGGSKDKYPGLVGGKPFEFELNSNKFELWTASNSGKISIMLTGHGHNQPLNLDNITSQLGKNATDKQKQDVKDVLAILVKMATKAVTLSQGTDPMAGKKSTPPAPNAPKPDLREAKRIQEVEMPPVYRQTVEALRAAACSLLFKACFAAGTKLLTPTGLKNIEDFQVGDEILSRAEGDPEGPVEAKRVEQTFVRAGFVLHLHVNGQVIRTSSEHPFYAWGKGWVQAAALVMGDWLLCADGSWVRVEEVHDTGEYETLYNLCIADHHTYFVSEAHWNFAVWSHNTYQADLAPLNAYRADFKGTLANADGTDWAYRVYALNMSARDWVAAQGSTMPKDHPYVYLVFDRSKAGTNQEIMKVGKTNNAWDERFGEDNRYRDLAILGVPISMYAFDVSGATKSAKDFEKLVIDQLKESKTATGGRKHWLPYDGNSRNGPVVPNPIDPYVRSVKRPTGNPGTFAMTPLLAGTPITDSTPRSRLDLNSTSWRQPIQALPGSRRYLYIMENRGEGTSPRKLLKVGVTGENGNAKPSLPGKPGTYEGRFSQYIPTAVNYVGGATFNYQRGVTLHLYDVTDIIGTSGTPTEQQSRHKALEMQIRRHLYAQGYYLPYDHELEDGKGTTPAWRTETDIFRRALFNG